MPQQLHILVAPPDAFTETLLAAERQQPGVTLEIVDLTQPEPDYAALVEKVFAADSVATW
jgi:hypothetical protein